MLMGGQKDQFRPMSGPINIHRPVPPMSGPINIHRPVPPYKQLQYNKSKNLPTKRKQLLENSL